MPVVDHYREQGKVVEVRLSGYHIPGGELRSYTIQVDSSPSVNAVYATVRAAIDPRLPTSAPNPTIPLKDSVGPEAGAPAV